MAGRHAAPSTSTGRQGRLIGAGSLLAALMSLLVIVPSSASAASTDNAQLTLTGLVDGNNPAGGSQLGVHPGDSIKFTASAAPTQKAKDLLSSIGAGGLLGGVLDSNVKFQVTADFSKLPGGHSKTKLVGSTSVTLKFSHIGKYSFTYRAQKVTTTTTPVGGLLGGSTTSTKTTDVALDGNQAKKAGVTLNASNQYVGTIVVAKTVSGGISVQVPKVNVQPSVTGVGKLPKISVPGVNVPTVHTTVPNLTSKLPKVNLPLPGAGAGGQKSGSSGSGGTGGLALTGGNGILPVPARVVPNGDGAAEYGGSGGGSGRYAALPGSGSANTGYTALALGSAVSAGKGATKGSGSSGVPTTVDLASDKTSSAQLPVLLAIVAVVALALVGATYARLFLLRRRQA